MVGVLVREPGGRMFCNDWRSAAADCDGGGGALVGGPVRGVGWTGGSAFASSPFLVKEATKSAPFRMGTVAVWFWTLLS